MFLRGIHTVSKAEAVWPCHYRKETLLKQWHCLPTKTPNSFDLSIFIENFGAQKEGCTQPDGTLFFSHIYLLER